MPLAQKPQAVVESAAPKASPKVGTVKERVNQINEQNRPIPAMIIYPDPFSQPYQSVYYEKEKIAEPDAKQSNSEETMPLLRAAAAIKPRSLNWWQRLKNWFSSGFTNTKKADLPQIKDFELEAKKKEVSGILDGYISWWKLSWFGHHHNERAKVVKEQVMLSTTTGQIKSLLEKQMYYLKVAAQVETPMLDGTYLTNNKKKTLSSRDWFTENDVKNSPKVLGNDTLINPYRYKSGYLDKIEDALRTFEAPVASAKLKMS